MSDSSRPSFLSSGLFSSIMGSLRRRPPPGHHQPPEPVYEDLGLKALRQVYSEYSRISNSVEKERQLYKLLPLFCKNCSQYVGQELATKFPEAFDFSENVSLIFVRRVTQITQTSINNRPGAALLKYFEANEDPETSSSGGTGFMLLTAIQVLSKGSEAIVMAMMSSSVCSVLVGCVNFFLDLPPPAELRNVFRTHTSPSSHPHQDPSLNHEHQHTTKVVNEMAERSSLERLIRSILNNLLRHQVGVEDLLRNGDLSLLFGAVSTPCQSYNKLWRKAAADCLITICRFSLSGDVVNFIHKNGCILFCMRNIKRSTDQPSLELVEILATIFCCLKDSSDFSQVLLDDFSSCGGYKFLHDYLLHLEQKPTPDDKEAVRNMVLLIQNLCMAGFLSLEPQLTDGGPFQDDNFNIPAPAGENCSIKNTDAFLVLQDVFLSSHSTHLGVTIIESILNIFKSDPANYFILDPHHSLSHFLERLTEKDEQVQMSVFSLLEYVMLELNYVPSAELTSIGLLLTQREHPKTLTMALNFLLKLISHSTKFKNVFREVGVLIMLVNALKVYATELRDGDMETDVATPTGFSSPSLPLEDVQGADEEYIFLLMECLRATIEDNIQNGQVFRESEGTKCALTLVHYKKPRRMTLRLLTQLILLKDGSVDFNTLLDQLNQSSQTAVTVKSEILQTVLGVFQLDSAKKAVFREVCGFHYLISVLASLIGSLAPQRSEPWIGVSRSDILYLVQLVFTVMTSAMQDDPANNSFFENNIRFDSFTAPLLLLGCFAKDNAHFKTTPTNRSHDHSPQVILSSGSFTNFEAEFKTWQQPSHDLDTDSSIFCAAEIFRFLRDMALDIPTNSSTSLIYLAKFDQDKEKNFFGSPPVTAAKLKGGTTTNHLVHPGAVLCMVDLLPAVEAETKYYKSEEMCDKMVKVEHGQNFDDLEQDITDHPSCGEGVESVDREVCGESELEGHGVVPSVMVTGVTDGSGGEQMMMDEEECCTMTLVEAKKWCIFLQERVVSEIYTLALSERNQQALCQVGLPERILQRCSSVLADDTHPLHQAMERTFEKLSYQALTPSDFRNFLRLGNPLSCSINDITIEDLKTDKYAIISPTHPAPPSTPLVQPSPATTTITTEQAHSPSQTSANNETQPTPLPSSNIDNENTSRKDSSKLLVENSLASDAQVQSVGELGLAINKNEHLKEVLADSNLSSLVEQSSDEVVKPVSLALEQEIPVKQVLDTTSSSVVVERTGDSAQQIERGSGEFELESTNQNAPFGGPLSLARIQSLVSMTTPRHFGQPGVMSSPPFVEFDLSIDGFGSLFLPSVFPINIDQGSSSSSAPPTGSGPTTSGLGVGGERPFPPSNGLTFSSWMLFNRCSLEDPHPIGLLTLSQTFFLSDNKKVTHYPRLRIYLLPADRLLVVSTLLPRERRDTVLEELIVKGDTKEKNEEAKFSCPQLFQLQVWHHIVVVINKSIRGKAKVTLFINGQSLDTQKMSYIHPIHVQILPPLLPYPSEATPFLISAHIGTHVIQRHVSTLTYRLGPTFLFEDPVPNSSVMYIHKLGPSYLGSFQAPVLQDQFSTSLSPGVTGEPLNALVSEDKVLFGLLASHPLVKTVHELDKVYSPVDVLTIARELALSEEDDVTPITLLHNTAYHLYGPARTLGAIICGYSGIRAFEPQPLRSLLSSVGGTSVMLGLVAMATTVDSLYASMKALVCIVGNNEIALKEMERTGGFQVLGMLLRSKAQLINSNILHLTYTLVGTVNSEHESACIPNLIAFRDLLADIAVWNTTGEEIQRSLFSHFYELLNHSGHQQANAEYMLNMKLVSVLLFHLLDETLSIATIKSICNVLSALLGIKPRQDDIRRVGQLLATTLPSNQLVNENTINLYQDDDDPTHSNTPTSTEHAQYGRFSGTEGKQRRAIVLRNIVLEVILSLLEKEPLELNTNFAHQLYQALGFDWLMLFMDARIHTQTVLRALRILIQLLTDNTLKQKFHDGDIFGGWVNGFESISSEMKELLSKSLHYFTPLKQHLQHPLPGANVLAHILPHHANLSQVYLLMVTNLLGKTCIDIPYSARFDTETLEELFHIGDTSSMAQQFKISSDAAYVLLTITRSLLHQDVQTRQAQSSAVDLIKFFDRLYRNVPEFARVASSQEFIEHLVSTLFPPVTLHEVGKGTSESEVGENDGDADWIMIEAEQLPGGGGSSNAEEMKKAILLKPENFAVRTIVKLLRTIAVDGFSSTVLQSKDIPASCPILERVLGATPPGISTELINHYQTLVLHNIVEYLQSGNEDITVLFKGTFASSVVDRCWNGLAVFCSRLVDKVWQDVYLNPPSTVYVFLLSLVEQARKTPKDLPLYELQRSLNRLILYQVSIIPASETEQKALMDTLCQFSSQSHVIFDDTNVDVEFLECLTFCLLRIVFADKHPHLKPDVGGVDGASRDGGQEMGGAVKSKSKLPSGYVPGSLAMMKSGANQLWKRMLEHKRKEMEAFLSADLPVPKNSGREALIASGIPSLTGGNQTLLRLQNCEHFLTDHLTKSWEFFVREERNSSLMDASQKDGRKSTSGGGGFLGTGLGSGAISKIKRGQKKPIVNIENLIQEYVETLCPLLVLAAQKYFESLLRKHQRNMEYKLRFAVSEWKKIEYELTRERGLWGPEIPSSLDKWMLDTVEGPCRMRKRLCINQNFYDHYTHKDQFKLAIKSKYQQPGSFDSELYVKRARLFQHPTLLTTPTSSVGASYHDNFSLTISKVSSGGSVSGKELSASAISLTPLPGHMTSSNQLDVFNHSDSDNPVAQTIYKLIEPDDKVTLQYQCAKLTGLDSRDGLLLLGTTHFYVIEGITISRYGEIIDVETALADSYNPVIPSHLQEEGGPVDTRQFGIQHIKWSYTAIREIHKRRYLLRRCAIEVFSSDGRNHFLIFHSNQRNKIYQKLLSLSKSSLSDSGFVAGTHPETDPEQTFSWFSVLSKERTLPEQWANGEISNFQYLIHLNTLAGRSYNDLMQYPIFPWVLADYNSETLDLTNPKSFRDFSKPMGAQSPARLKRFIERYKYFEDPTEENTPPYYYGTHYSSAMIVASYLIRMEPFTQYFLKLQGGHFDLPDRLFHSIPVSWRSASETNMADIKELIPEFFYLPEFLTNSNRFNLGTKQSGEVLGDVVLPPWAKGDPNEFIRIHRQALECDYVSAHLHEWIDLIFGCKQGGEEAVKAHNVFHHLFYEGAVDIDKIEDSVKRIAAISFIHNFGQMPKQLFRKPHRQRKVFSSTSVPAVDAPLATPTNVLDSKRVFYKNLVQLMPSKEPIKEIRGEVSQMISVSDRTPIAVEKNKILLLPNYSRYFMWGFPDCSARIALVETDRMIAVFEGLHQGRILCSAVLNDTTLLTGGDSTVVCVWKIRHASLKDRSSRTQLRLKHTLHGHTASVICLATSANYNLIVSGSKDKTCIIWDSNNFTFIRQLGGHSSFVSLVTINQLNGNIVSCTKNQIRLWTVNGTLIAESASIITGNFRFTCCAVSELFDWDSDNVIITGSSDGIVRMWSMEYVRAGETSTRRRRLSTSDLGDSYTALDFPPRDKATTVVRKLKQATIKRGRAKSSPQPMTSGADETDYKESFRPTGQTSQHQTQQPPQTDHRTLVQQTDPSDINSPTDEPSQFDLDQISAMLDADDLPSEIGVAPKAIFAVKLGDGENLKNNSRSEDDAGSSMSEDSEVILLDMKSETSLDDDSSQVETNETQVPSSNSDSSIRFHDDDVSTQVDDTGSHNRVKLSHEELHDVLESGSHDQQPESHERESGSPDETSQADDSQNKPSNSSVATTTENSASEERVKPKTPKQDLTDYMEEQRRQSEELKAKAGKWTRKLTQVHALTMHTSFSRQDNDTPAPVTSLCISKDHRKLFVGDARGRIFSWTVSDNLGSVMEHWLKDEAVDKCMKCGVEFTFTERKHHCRDCGKIYCAKCSCFESEIERLRITKKVRVCVNCHEKIIRTNKTTYQ